MIALINKQGRDGLLHGDFPQTTVSFGIRGILMILTLLDKLIDRCIQLIKHRAEVQRNVFNDFVLPVFSEFEVVHNNYLDTFHKYRQLLKTSDKGCDLTHPIFDLIKEDIIFTKGQRLKVLELARANGTDAVSQFVNSICRYFSAVSDRAFLSWMAHTRIEGVDTSRDIISALRGYEIHTEQRLEEYKGAISAYLNSHQDGNLLYALDEYVGSNAPRITLTFFLVTVFSLPLDEEIKLGKALDAIDSIVEITQWNYAGVTDDFLRLKRRMLK